MPFVVGGVVLGDSELLILTVFVPLTKFDATHQYPTI